MKSTDRVSSEKKSPDATSTPPAPRGSRSDRDRISAIADGDQSTASTRPPRSASAIASLPVPQPGESTSLPPISTPRRASSSNASSTTTDGWPSSHGVSLERKRPCQYSGVNHFGVSGLVIEPSLSTSRDPLFRYLDDTKHLHRSATHRALTRSIASNTFTRWHSARCPLVFLSRMRRRLSA